MSLSILPDEAVLIIAGHLPRYRDIRALRCANRRFCSLFKGFRFKNRHKALLHYTTALGDLRLATELLDGFVTAETTQSQSRSHGDTDANKDEMNSAIWAHPLLKEGYTPYTMLDIPFALLTAVEENTKQLVMLLVDRGAKGDFRFPVELDHDPFGGPCACGSTTTIDKTSILASAVKSGDNKLFDLLMDNVTEMCTAKNHFPLDNAVEGRQFHMLKVLLERNEVCPHQF